MDMLEKFKQMTPEEAQAYLDAFEAEGRCSGNCSACQSECNSRVEKPAKLAISVLSGKGGTGNSTITALLACSLTKAGLKVGILDADISSASIPHMFGIEGKMESDGNGFTPLKTASGIEIVSLAIDNNNELDPVIYPSADKTKLSVLYWIGGKWSKDLDVLLVDLPKAADDITLEYFTTMPLDVMIAVSNPGKVAGIMTNRAVNLGHMLMMPVLGIIENFADSDSEDTFTERYGDGTTLLASIPYSVELRKAAENGKIEEYESDELGFLTRAICDEVNQTYEEE